MMIEELTRDAAKRDRYPRDTYYVESLARLRAWTDDPAGFARRHALVLLKPDSVAGRAIEPALDWLSGAGYRVVAAAPTRLTRHVVRALWGPQWYQASPQRRWLGDLFAAATESLVLVVRGPAGGPEPAAPELTRLKGPADPDRRRPGELRYALGRHSFLLNLVHTADEPADVIRELAVYFDDAVLDEVYGAALSGRDRTEEARALAAGLYSQTPALGLSFAPAADRLVSAVGRLLASLDPDLRPPAGLGAAYQAAVTEHDHRALAEALWRLRLVPDPWDVVIVCSHLLPMNPEPAVPASVAPGPLAATGGPR